jgi:N-carbamoyl-L-amino-acid hydrolase
VDSVTDGGNFDGAVGSFSAIEVARSLREQNVRLRHPLEVVVFQNEEGGTFGSKLMIGELPAEDLDLTARSGKTIREGIGLIGGDVTRLEGASAEKGRPPLLHRVPHRTGWLAGESGTPIGVVEGIVGLRRMDVTIDGFANPRRHHAHGPAPGRDARGREVHGPR